MNKTLLKNAKRCISHSGCKKTEKASACPYFAYADCRNVLISKLYEELLKYENDSGADMRGEV